MKKVLSILLALSMVFAVFALVACGDEKDGETTTAAGTTAAWAR